MGRGGYVHYWTQEGNDELVLAPVIEKLSKLQDNEIFHFHNIMAKLLYDIDGKNWAKDTVDNFDDFSDDGFLYSRCIAIVNGEKYYDEIKNRKRKLDGDLEFESILYVPMEAWAKKHTLNSSDYPHITEYSYETGSNKKQW